MVAKTGYKPDKPETIKWLDEAWEALNDQQARNIILTNLHKYIDVDKLNANIKRGIELKKKMK